MITVADLNIDNVEFYQTFEPGLYYYLVERTGARDEIRVDHFRSVYDNRAYVACEELLVIDGLKPIETPEVPIEEPDETDELEVIVGEREVDESNAV